MGLDQYLLIEQPNILEPSSRGTEIGYWRKDWSLQNAMNTDNGEYFEVSLELCEDILNSLESIYEDSSGTSYLEHTRECFTKARDAIINSNARILYEGDW